ncbi:MAG: hypothetical protein JXR52_06030 [Bacteroidales bacterium]|nr:hypothetical protein [Bacteroidales bacterium]MBN2698366.1 hypothetical protein [Bacteroidales bacterium]
MKKQTVFIAVILILNSTLLAGQKKCYELLPARWKKEIPGAIVDTGYYSHILPVSPGWKADSADSVPDRAAVLQPDEQRNPASSVSWKPLHRAVILKSGLIILFFFRSFIRL